MEIGRHVELVATAYADELSMRSLAEISAITADQNVRIIGGQMASLLLTAFPVPGIDVRRTRDADAAITTELAGSGVDPSASPRPRVHGHQRRPLHPAGTRTRRGRRARSRARRRPAHSIPRRTLPTSGTRRTGVRCGPRARPRPGRRPDHDRRGSADAQRRNAGVHRTSADGRTRPRHQGARVRLAPPAGDGRYRRQCDPAPRRGPVPGARRCDKRPRRTCW